MSRASRLLWGLLVLMAGFLVLSFFLRSDDEVPEDLPEPRVPVRTLTLRAVSLQSQIDLPARLEADYRAQLAVEKAGRVAELLVDQGDAVTEGQVLVRLDDALWRAALDRAEIEWRQAQKEARRFDELVRGGAISTSEVDAVHQRLDLARVQREEARTHLAQCEVRSPVEGVILDRQVEVGEYLAEGAGVLEVVRLDPIRVVVQVPEREITHVQEGDPLGVVFDLDDLTAVTGRVSFVAPASLAGEAVFRVESRVPNALGGLKPGMLATARLWGEPQEGVLAVPLRAVLPWQGEHYVFVVEEGRAVRRLVKLDRIQAGQAILSRGVSPGDRLVIEGQRSLTDGRRVDERSHAPPEESGG